MNKHNDAGGETLPSADQGSGLWLLARVFTRGYGGIWTRQPYFETIRPGDTLREATRRVARDEGVRLDNVRLEIVS